MKTEVFAAIQSERDYHRLLWPRHTHTVGEWILIMEKCLADARLAWVHGHGDDTHALSEIRQVTAVGVAAMEEHTPPLRELPKLPAPENSANTINAKVLVEKLGHDLVGRRVITGRYGQYPGGEAVVTQLFPDPNGAPEISFEVKHPTAGLMGIFEHEDVILLPPQI